MDLSNLAMDSATTMVKFMGEECKVEYRPTLITTKALEDAASEATQDNPDKFLQLLSDLLISWDLYQAGEVVGTDLDAVKSVPLAFVRAVYLQVMEDSGRGEAGKPSSDG